MIQELETTRIGDIVAKDFRAAAVFQRFGIDFCCGGARSVNEACRKASIDPGAVVGALNALQPADESVDDASTWSLDLLVTHIVDTHHAYIRSSGPAISSYLEKLVKVHGARHPELSRVAATFNHIHQELMPHMMKEEHVLFPYVTELAKGVTSASSPFGTVENPIRMLEREHEEVGEAMRLIRELTNDFTPPSDGCTTYRVCFAELERFELDLHRHVHLENNVLFPKAVVLEQAALQSPTACQ